MRRLIPGIMLLVATVAIGCNSSTSSSGGGGGSSKKDMIVGVWEVTKMGGEDAPKGATITMEFFKDGKLVMMEQEGTYEIDGDQITMKQKDSKQEPDKATIKTLTADTMVLSNKDPKKGDLEAKKKKTK